MPAVFGVATVFNVEDRQRLYSVSEAARMLRTTEAAVRARINRGKLASEKIDNTVYVRLDPDTTPVHPGEQTALVEALRDQVATLKQQLNTEQEASAELRRIIAALTSRIPELGAPESPPESPQRADSPGPRERPFTAEERATVEAAQPRPWWRRVFKG